MIQTSEVLYSCIQFLNDIAYKISSIQKNKRYFICSETIGSKILSTDAKHTVRHFAKYRQNAKYTNVTRKMSQRVTKKNHHE